MYLLRLVVYRQTSLILGLRMEGLLNADGGTLYKSDIILTAGVGGRSYSVQGIMNLTITLTNNETYFCSNQTQRHIFLRATVCRDVLTDLTIGLPSILYFDLLPFRQTHMPCHTSCEMCAINPLQPEFKSPVTQISSVTDLALLNVNELQRIPNPCRINVPNNLTDFINDIIPPLAHQHLTYGSVVSEWDILPY